MAKHKIALIPGDGIGKEVLPEGVRVLEAAGRRFNFQLEFTDFDWSCDRLRQDRQDDAGRRHGAAQGVREHLPRRRRLAGRARPRLAVGPADPDPPRLRRVREPAPGAPVRGRAVRRSPTASRARSTSGWCARTPRASTARSAAACSRAPTNEMAIQQAIFTRKGVDRVHEVRLRVRAARRKKKHVTSATKSNGIIHTMPFWDERFDAMQQEVSRTSRRTSTTSTS